MVSKAILDGPPQFVLLIGLLATGLTLSFVANGLLQRMAKGDATEEEKKAFDWLLVSVFMQLSIAVALCVRIMLSALDIRNGYFDLILVWSFLVTLVAWGYIFITSYYKHIRRKIDWRWAIGIIGVSLAPLLLSLL